MHSIEIDDDVFAELSNRATGFHVSPNDVLRRLLNLSGLPDSRRIQPAPNAASQPAAAISLNLSEFIRSDRFRHLHQAVDKFLAILGWVHHARPKQFEEVTQAFRRGSRRYFGKSEREILQSGGGITARPIPESPFWALTTLDNKSKRLVLEDVLRALSFPRGDINLALAELPDSGIRRSHARSRLLASL